MKRKFFLGICVVLILLSFTLCVYADDPVAESTDEAEPVDDLYSEELKQHIYNWTNANLGEPKVEYTYDSVRTDGIYLEPYIDILTQTMGMQIVITDLDFGVCIYDDPATEEIDGLRVNGATINSLKFPLEGSPHEISVAVRLDYKEGVVGDIARISDGSFDWTSLLANPLVLCGVLYYAISILVLVASAISAVRGKNKKIKTADEIASSVDERISQGLTALQTVLTSNLDNQVAPVLKASSDSTQKILKALAISTSKSKDAPAAILDTLQEACGVDIDEIIQKAKQAIQDSDAQLNLHKENVTKILDNIAAVTDSYREDNHEAEQSKSTENTEAKSVF